jgi:hypothetical protein
VVFQKIVSHVYSQTSADVKDFNKELYNVHECNSDSGRIMCSVLIKSVELANYLVKEIDTKF